MSGGVGEWRVGESGVPSEGVSSQDSWPVVKQAWSGRYTSALQATYVHT